MAETALNFGPDWIRALAHGPTQPATTNQPAQAAAPVPRYSLAQYRYGREEMLALIPKDPKRPECLKRDTSKVVRDTFMMPLALTPVTEDEQRLWSRSVNSDAVLRASGKSVSGNGIGRGGRGGSIDRGRGRGRGGYYQRGVTYEDSEDSPQCSFSRPKPIERSQSASEKDQRWDDRERRFDRSYSGRGGGIDDSMPKSEQSRSSHEYWRKHDKDDDIDWRSSSYRSSDKIGSRGSWRNPIEKERRDLERNPSSRSLNGNLRGSHSHQKIPGNHLPEWSVDESNEQDVVGTFDSSGAFLETKLTENNSDEIYVSDDADEGMPKDSPEAKKDSLEKSLKKSIPHSQVNASNKTITKQIDSVQKEEEPVVGKQSPNISEHHSKTLTNVAVIKSADHVIKSKPVQHHIVNIKNPDYMPVTLPNVPQVAAKCIKKENVIHKHGESSEISTPITAVEEDAFAHHKKATENMVAQWTEEEEQKVISHSGPPVQEKENKWFYQDPQGEIQGPFNSPEMLEWFSAGYFTMSLMVRRSYDEKFSQLGDLIKSWGRIPFMPGNSPPPIRVTPMTSSLPSPVTQTTVPNPVATPVTNQLPKQGEQLLALQQQLLQQQLMQQQLMLRQAQLQQLLSQLKQQDNFASLSSQQQQQVLMQQFMAQQQIPRPNLTGVTEQPSLVDTMTPMPLPLLGLPMAPIIKNELSLWNMPPSNSWPINVTQSQQSSAGSIWDIDQSKQASEESDLEKQKRLAEEQEKHRKAEEERLAQEKEIEEKRKLEELRRKQEEERILKELQKQEEEKRRLEEQRCKEEEKRRQEELRRLEEQKQKEEEQRKEELRKIEEQKRLEELKRQEELKRLEELKRKEEERRQEELRKQEEQKRIEKRKKEELQKKIEMEQERERIEMEKEKEAIRLKEIEREQQLQRERQKQKEKEEEMKRLAEIKLKSQGPAWGIQNSHSESQLSLADIQRLQGEKEKEEREEKERLRQHILQQQVVKQTQQMKNGLSWAKRSAESQPAVKSLAEIQQEEAERLAEQQRNQKPPAPAPVIISNVGVWGNASHLNRITATPPNWNMNNAACSGFWDDALNSTQVKKQSSKNNDSAFPALSNPEKPATIVHSNKNKNIRAKKDEEAIKKIFGNRKPTDEFTAWCTEALSAMPSSVDVPTFVAFLKDIESPYEVHDYVKSYLGDGKEPREFAKQFLERRSKFRAKQTSSNEDNSLWGPAPAITPVVNKTISQPVNDSDGNSNSKGKSKRRKNRMQKLDNSMLGFTVQSNPDRLNVGEIDHIEM